MTERSESRRKHIFGRILVEVLLPAIGFGISVGFATRNWLASFITGLAISSTLQALYMLDQAFLRPRLKGVSPDWLQLGLEMTSSLLEHILGGSLALLVCSRIFDFGIMPSLGWAVVGGMVIVFPIIHGTELALRYFRQLKEKEQQEEQLRALATEAELKALKAQINPHFLFNTLNTIAALIHADPAQAEATVERLAEMFRYVLNGSERGLVSLGEELAFLDVYLEIEQARFGERLRVTREISPGALGVSVPSLILQPLVENAIRHGQAGDGRVSLTIRVQPQAKVIVITIVDQGPGMSTNHKIGESPGHGLRNVDERLRKTYGDGYGLGFVANEPQGTVVTVKIPAESKE